MEFICSFVNRCFHSCHSWDLGPGREFLVGVCHPVLQTLTLFQTRQFHFSHPFFRPDLLNPSSFSDQKINIMSRLLRIIMEMRAQTKNFFKCTEFSYFQFFLSHLKLKGSICPYALVVPSKTILDSRPKWVESLYPFSDQKGPKTISFEAAHTYTAYIRECPPRTSDSAFVLSFSRLGTYRYPVIC